MSRFSLPPGLPSGPKFEFSPPSAADLVRGIPVVEHPLIDRPTVMKHPGGGATLFIPPGEEGREVLFQLRTQAVAWTFKRALEEG